MMLVVNLHLCSWWHEIATGFSCQVRWSMQAPQTSCRLSMSHECSTHLNKPLCFQTEGKKLTASLQTSLHRSLKAGVPCCYYLTPTDCLYDRDSTHNFIWNNYFNPYKTCGVIGSESSYMYNFIKVCGSTECTPAPFWKVSFATSCIL